MYHTDDAPDDWADREEAANEARAKRELAREEYRRTHLGEVMPLPAAQVEGMDSTMGALS